MRCSELTATERKNADFLVAYLDELRASLPQEALDYHGPFHTPGLGPFPPKRTRGPKR